MRRVRGGIGINREQVANRSKQRPHALVSSQPESLFVWS
jgi:hypothetical protein